METRLGNACRKTDGSPPGYAHKIAPTKARGFLPHPRRRMSLVGTYFYSRAFPSPLLKAAGSDDTTKTPLPHPRVVLWLRSSASTVVFCPCKVKTSTCPRALLVCGWGINLCKCACSLVVASAGWSQALCVILYRNMIPFDSQSLKMIRVRSIQFKLSFERGRKRPLAPLCLYPIWIL